MVYLNRRRFLQTSAAATFTAGTSTLASLTNQRAFAADTTGYKALVGVFLFGGMDHVDTVLHYDQPSYDAMRAHRPGIMNAHGAARQRQNLLRLQPDNAADLGGLEYALPQDLGGIHNMFENGEAAIVGSVGPLFEPTTREDMETRMVDLPPRLYSHNDQQSTWMSLDTEGARFGWGGRFADAILASNTTDNPLFTAISASGQEVFLAGENTRQFRISSGGPPTANILDRRGFLGGEAGDDEARDRIRSYLERQSTDSQNLYLRDVAASQGRALPNAEAFSEAFSNLVPFTTEFPNSGLGRQLQSIAESLAIQTQVGNSRQIFFARTGGFDTHSNQGTNLPNRQQDVDQALTAFREAMVEIGMWNDVTVFTMSDFGRTMVENGDGTDHGWGSHQFVMGGSVRGRRVYGSLPDTDIDSQRYTDSRGRLIPSHAVEQYAASLGNWFGLDNTELNAALPRLSGFDEQNLGLFG